MLAQPLAVMRGDDEIHPARESRPVVCRPALFRQLVGAPVMTKGGVEVLDVVEVLAQGIPQQHLIARRQALLQQPLHRLQPGRISGGHAPQARKSCPRLRCPRVDRDSVLEQFLRLGELPSVCA